MDSYIKPFSRFTRASLRRTKTLSYFCTYRWVCMLYLNVFALRPINLSACCFFRKLRRITNISNFVAFFCFFCLFNCLRFSICFTACCCVDRLHYKYTFQCKQYVRRRFWFDMRFVNKWNISLNLLRSANEFWWNRFCFGLVASWKKLLPVTQLIIHHVNKVGVLCTGIQQASSCYPFSRLFSHIFYELWFVQLSSLSMSSIFFVNSFISRFVWIRQYLQHIVKWMQSKQKYSNSF